MSGDGAPSDAGRRSKSKIEPTPLVSLPIPPSPPPKPPQSPSRQNLQPQQQPQSSRPPSIYLSLQSKTSRNNSTYYWLIINNILLVCVTINVVL